MMANGEDHAIGNFIDANGDSNEYGCYKNDDDDDDDDDGDDDDDDDDGDDDNDDDNTL